MGDLSSICEFRGRAAEGKGCTLVNGLRHCAKRSSFRTGSQRDCTTGNVDTFAEPNMSAYPNSPPLVVIPPVVVPPLVPVVARLAALYADDFSMPVAASPLTGRANWTTPDANAGNLEVVGSYVHNKSLYGPAALGLFGDSAESFEAVFEYNTVTDATNDPWQEVRQTFYLWYIDAQNNMKLEISKNNSRLNLASIVAGGNYGRNWSGVTFKPTGEIRVRCRNGVFAVMLDGVWLPNNSNPGGTGYPRDVADFRTEVAAANRKGKLGFTINTYRYPVLYGASLEPIYFFIDTFDDFVGRDSLTATGGTALLTGTFVAGANPTSWVVRVLNANTKAVVSDWATIDNVQVSGQTMTGGVFLPTGGPYMIEAGYIDGSDGKARLATSRACWSGIRGETWGQSNSIGRNVPYDGTVNYQKVAGALTKASSFDAGVSEATFAHTLNAYQVNTLAGMAEVISVALGKPVGVTANGVAGVGIDALSPGGNNWPIFPSAVANRRGIVEFVLWDQGEGDADAVYSPDTYANKFLNNLLPGLRSATGNPTLPVFISPVGRYASAAQPGPNSAAQADAYRNVLRQAYLTICASDPRVFISDHKLGTTHTDAYHYARTILGYPEMGRRAGYTIAKRLGANVFDGTGAKVVSAARAGAVIDLMLDLNGGSGISDITAVAPNTGTVPMPTLQSNSGYQVSADNFGTTLAISSVARNGNAIRITLASDPGAAVKVRSFYGWSFDDNMLFYTTGYADGRAPIPVAPIMTPIEAA